MLADVWRLVFGSASSSRDLVVEASSRVQGARSASGSSASSSRGSDSSSTPSRGARGHRPERILPLAQVAEDAPRILRVKRKRESSVGTRRGPGVRILYLGFLMIWAVPKIWRKKNGWREWRGCLIAMPPTKESGR